MKILKTYPRGCACCEGNNLELVWNCPGELQSSHETWSFPIRTVVCRDCGFCFNSPCPDQLDLDVYYRDSLSILQSTPSAYSMAKRVNVIKKYASKSKVFFEVGGNEASDFHKRIIAYFKKTENLELNEGCLCRYRDIADVGCNYADVLVHYDVLEHVADLNGFLMSCYKVLKNNGKMICEVPDLRLYPGNLMLFSAPHVNHFSVRTLTRIAQKYGFSLVEVGHMQASRPFSFLAVFEKSDCRLNMKLPDPCEVLDNLTCLRDGVAQINTFNEQVKCARKRVVDLCRLNKKVTLWCVTDLLKTFLDKFRLPQGVLVVDVDPRKKSVLEKKGIAVSLPLDSREYIRESDLIVIFSPRNQNHVLDWIKKEIGVRPDKEKILVLGSGVYGEPLQV